MLKIVLRFAIAIALLGVAPVALSPRAVAEGDLGGLVNQERAQRGLAPLVVEPILDDEAQAHANQMSSSGSLYHSSSFDPSAGPWEKWGENVGRGSDVVAVHRALMGSAYHAENILDPAFTSIGIGVAARPDGVFVTELFVRRPPGYMVPGVVSGGGATEGITKLSTTWLFADGATRPGFDEYLVIVNPGSPEAHADIAFSGPAGPVGSTSIVIPAGGRSTVHVNEFVPPGDVSAELSSDRPVAAMRSLFVANGQVADGDVSPGATSPEVTWYLPEGYTGAGFRTFLTFFNPNDDPATARLVYMTNAGPRNGRPLSIAPHGRSTVLVNDELPNAEVSTQVDADLPITVERTELFDFHGIRGLHNAGGYTAPATSFRFAEGFTGTGFQEYLLLQNPSIAPVTARVSLLSSRGQVWNVDVGLAPRSRSTVDVNAVVGRDQEVAASVDAPSGILAEQAQYFLRDGYQGGTDSLGTVPATSWILPEGYTGPGFQTYILLANFGTSPATAQVTYLTERGPQGRAPVTVPPRSRVTINARNDLVGSFGVSITSNRPVVVAESEYFRKRI